MQSVNWRAMRVLSAIIAFLFFAVVCGAIAHADPEPVIKPMECPFGEWIRICDEDGECEWVLICR